MPLPGQRRRPAPRRLFFGLAAAARPSAASTSQRFVAVQTDSVRHHRPTLHLVCVPQSSLGPCNSWMGQPRTATVAASLLATATVATAAILLAPRHPTACGEGGCLGAGQRRRQQQQQQRWPVLRPALARRRTSSLRRSCFGGSGGGGYFGGSRHDKGSHSSDRRGRGSHSSRGARGDEPQRPASQEGQRGQTPCLAGCPPPKEAKHREPPPVIQGRKGEHGESASLPPTVWSVASLTDLSSLCRFLARTSFSFFFLTLSLKKCLRGSDFFLDSPLTVEGSTKNSVLLEATHHHHHLFLSTVLAKPCHRHRQVLCSPPPPPRLRRRFLSISRWVQWRGFFGSTDSPVGPSRAATCFFFFSSSLRWRSLELHW